MPLVAVVAVVVVVVVVPPGMRAQRVQGRVDTRSLGVPRVGVRRGSAQARVEAAGEKGSRAPLAAPVRVRVYVKP